MKISPEKHLYVNALQNKHEMKDDLGLKLKKWLSPNPRPITPRGAAVIAHACARKIKQEDWEDETAKKRALQHLNGLIETLYLCNKKKTTGEFISEKTALHFFKNLRNRHPEMLNDQNIDKIIDHGLFKRKDMVALLPKREHKQRIKFRRQIRHASQGKDFGPESVMDIPARLDFDGYEEVKHFVKEACIDFISTLSRSNHPTAEQIIAPIYTPEDGPRTAYEFLFCLKLYGSKILSSSLDDLRNEDLYRSLTAIPKIAAHNAMRNVMEAAAGMVNDLPRNRVTQKLDQDFDTTKEILKSHALTIERFLGLARFFVEHNRGKISADSYNKIKSNLMRLHMSSIQETIINFSNYQSLQEQNPDIFTTTFENTQAYWYDYPRPSPDDLSHNFCEQANKKFNAKRARKLIKSFKKIRAERPNNMEEQVVLYKKDPLFFRKLRSSLFKSNNPRSGNGEVKGSPRVRFIKLLAEEERHNLRLLGLDDTDINSMKESGKIPNHSNLSVEHITDREIGGGNHFENFILMDKDTNNLKDQFKNLQTRISPVSEEYCWIISWIPKKDKNGRFPNVFHSKCMG